MGSEMCIRDRYTAVNSWRYADGEPADPMPAWQIAMIVADVVLGVALVGLEAIAIMRFVSRRRAGAGAGVTVPAVTDTSDPDAE